MTRAKLSPEERKAREEQRRKEQIPKNRSYTLKNADKTFIPVKVEYTENSINFGTTLAGKPVTCMFGFGKAKVERRVRMYGKVIRDPATKKPMVVQVDLPATFVTLQIGKEEFTAKSVCKPPDKMDRKTGMKFALRHLMKQKDLHHLLGNNDYETLVRVCLTKPPKPGQIARHQRLKALAQAGKTDPAKTR